MFNNSNDLNFEQMKKNIIEYIQTLPDSAKWKDFYDSSVGQTIVELIAGLGVFLKYEATINKRESYIQHAKSRESVLGLAQNLGYSSKRHTPIKIALTLTPNNSLLIQKYDIIGYTKGVPIVSADEYNFIKNQPITIDAYVAIIEEEIFTLNTNKPTTIEFTRQGISSIYELYLNDTKMETSEQILDLINEKFIVQTNSYNSVSIMYLNLPHFKIKYKVNDKIKLKYLIGQKIEFTEKQIELLYAKDATSFQYIHQYIDDEDIETIKINAVLQHETSFLVRSREDYKKIFKLSLSKIADTALTDLSPAVVGLSYILDDYSVLTQAEKTEILKKLSSRRPIGVMPPIIKDPDIYFINIAISVILKSQDINIQNTVEQFINSYNKSFDTILNFNNIEHEIERLDSVKISRVSLEYVQRENNKHYRKGTAIRISDDYSAICIGRIFKSGTVEPVINITQRYYNDGDIIWILKTKESENQTFPLWVQEKEYEIGDKIQTNDNQLSKYYYLEAYKYITKSKSDIKSTYAEGEYEGILFRAVNAGTIGNSIKLTFSGYETVYQIIENYNQQNPNNQVIQINGSPLFIPSEGELSLSGGIDYVSGEPVWVVGQSKFIEDGDLLWLCTQRTGSPQKWKENNIYNIGDTVIPTDDQFDASGLYMFVCIGYLAKTGASEPVFQENQHDIVHDDRAKWLVIKNDISINLPKKYNEYYYFKPKIEIS